MITHPILRTISLLLVGLALACWGLLLAEAGPTPAATITVNTVADENDHSCADGDCSLRDAIEIAAAGDTIVFAPALSGQTITLTLGTLVIWDKSITIDGSGLAQHVKISGNHAARVFLTLSPDGVTLRELDIVNGYVADGSGGAGIYNQRTLTVVGCTITGNVTPNNGGGLRNTGTATVEDSTIANNQGEYGGGIRNEGDLTVRHSTISDNTADFGGGIDNYVGSLTMTDTTVERNTANFYGGGMTTGAPATIEDSAFNGNSAQAGGGIDSHETDVTLTLTRCTFTGNTATEDGGALLNDDATVEVQDSTFTANTADNAGGGIRNGPTGAMTVNGGAFTGNTASSAAAGWGGAIENHGMLQLTGATFADNAALINGGAIENWAGNLTVSGCTFTGNSAAAGGAINNNWYGTLTVADSTFQDNIADHGGALFNDNESQVEITGSTFAANSATDTTGGGIQNTLGTITVDNSTFSGNTAASYGGGINHHAGTLTLTHCTLADNSAGGGGGISVGAAGTLSYRNTIVAGSAGGDCNLDGTIVENVHNLVGDSSCSPLLSGDPRLGPLQDNGGPTPTYALLPDSPAIDMGDASACLAADQRGEPRDDWACDIGAFELRFSDSDHVVKAIAGPGVYTFGPTRVKVEVLTPGALDELTVTKVEGDHAGRTGGGGGGGGVGWGEWFALSPNDGANGTFQASLTLPTLFAPDANDKVCRYLGGMAWDCTAHGFGLAPFAHITRQGVSAFSDWAAGDEVGPNAVTVRQFRARPWSWIERLTLLLRRPW